MSEELTYSAGFRQAVVEEMESNPAIFVIGTDLYHRGGHFGQVLGVGERFGRERVRDAPISEAALVAAGVGAALNGMKPIVDLNFIDFSFGAMDEIVNQAAKIPFVTGHPVPVLIRASSGVALGGAQHNNCLEGWFASVVGLNVAVPSTPFDVKGLAKTALRGNEPVVFLMHKRLSALRGQVGGADECVPFGQAIVRRHGDGCTVIGYGGSMELAMKAASIVADDGVEVEVIDLRTLSPLDMDTVASSVRRTGRAVVVDEAPRFATFPAEIVAAIQETCFEYLDAPVRRVGAALTPIAASPPLIEAALPTVQDVVTAVEQTFTAFTGESG